MLFSWEGNRRPGGKYWQPTAGFMTKSPAGRLPRDQDQLRAEHLLIKYGSTLTITIALKSGTDWQYNF